MAITVLAFMALAEQCAPTVAPETLVAISRVESGLDPLAIGVNGRQPQHLHPANRTEAVATARRLIGRGASIDLGLGQINARNLAQFRLSIADAFDPCRNLSASAQVLVADYTLAGPRPGTEQAALRTSLSFYNTGDARRGFRNGYVAKVTAVAGQVVPAIQADAKTSGSSPAPPDWDVFARLAASTATFVFSVATSGDGQ